MKYLHAQKRKIRKILAHIKEQGILWTILLLLRWIFLHGMVHSLNKYFVDPIEDLMIRLEKKRHYGPDTITCIETIKLAEKKPYYVGRWEYFSKVIELVVKEKPTKVLELGPFRSPIVKNSDTMDMDSTLPNITYYHDATKTPYPIEDSAYDMFIALQVWEHLDGKQRDAFKEVMRISKMAILSFPYKWNWPGNCHHNIDENVIADWTLHIQPEQIIKVENRIIYFFRFES